MTQTEKFWNKIAKKYAARPIENPEDYQKKLKITAGYMNSTMNVLEFGCGTGGAAIEHAPRVKSYRAIDLSDAMLGFAREKAAQTRLDNLVFEVNTIEAISLDKNSLDMVLGLSILHLLENKEASLAKVYQALKPGGYFVSSTTCMKENYAWFKYVNALGRRLGLLPLLRIFSCDELRGSITDTGFTIVHEWWPAKNRALFLVAQKPGPR